MRVVVLVLVLSTCGCSVFSGGNLSPACHGLEVAATQRALAADTPLRRALLRIKSRPRVLRGTSVRPSVANVPVDYPSYDPGGVWVPNDNRACLARVSGPVVALYWAPEQTTSTDRYTNLWIGSGIGQHPYLECLARGNDTQYGAGFVSSAGSVPGLVIGSRYFNGIEPKTEFYAAEPELLISPGIEPPFTPEQMPRPQGSLEPSVAEMMRRVDVSQDGFEALQAPPTPTADGRSWPFRWWTIHYTFVAPGQVRACYVYGFDQPREAAAASSSIANMFDTLEDWGSQKSERGQEPRQDAVIAPRGLSTFEHDRLAGIQAEVPVRDFRRLNRVVDAAIDSSVGSPDEKELSRRNIDRIWGTFQPRPGLDYE